MEPTSFLAAYGITASSLSPDVKDGINEVFRAATREGLQQLGQILAKEAQKRGINTGTGTASTTAQDEAIKAAQEEYEKLEAEKKAKKQKNLLLAIAGGVIVIGIVIAVVLTRKKKNQ